MTEPKRRPIVGFVVNPFAGIGGTAGLKGSDGADIIRQAQQLGAVSPSAARAKIVAEGLAGAGFTHVVTGPGELGATVAVDVGLTPEIVDIPRQSMPTTAVDTRNTVTAMMMHGVDVVVFVGGDGTARDVAAAIDDNIPMVGVPSGVKMHSAVFAATPRRALDVVLHYVPGVTATSFREVMDLDESALRDGRVSAHLHGMARVPDDPRNMQPAKSPSRRGADVDGIAEAVVARCGAGACYVLGPGTTTAAVARHLGVSTTLLGVDVVVDRQPILVDANEAELFAVLAGRDAWIVLSVTGGQGFVLGRGNQQISPRVVRQVGVDRVVIAATDDKLSALGGPLRVDTGDQELDGQLSGYRRVVTGFRREAMWKIEA